MLPEITGAERHDEVPEADERTVVLSKQADDDVAVVNHAAHLLPGEQAFLHTPGGTPVEDAGAVVVVADQVRLCLHPQLLVLLEGGRQLAGERTEADPGRGLLVPLGNDRSLEAVRRGTFLPGEFPVVGGWRLQQGCGALARVTAVPPSEHSGHAGRYDRTIALRHPRTFICCQQILEIWEETGNNQYFSVSALTLPSRWHIYT